VSSLGGLQADVDMMTDSTSLQPAASQRQTEAQQQVSIVDLYLLVLRAIPVPVMQLRCGAGKGDAAQKV